VRLCHTIFISTFHLALLTISFLRKTYTRADSPTKLRVSLDPFRCVPSHQKPRSPSDRKATPYAMHSALAILTLVSLTGIAYATPAVSGLGESRIFESRSDLNILSNGLSRIRFVVALRLLQQMDWANYVPVQPSRNATPSQCTRTTAATRMVTRSTQIYSRYRVPKQQSAFISTPSVQPMHSVPC